MRIRLSYANVMASAAMFVALGGSSYAAVKLKRDSVTTREIKDGTIATADLASGVGASGPMGARGPRGVEGPAGPRGVEGPAGPRGPSRILVRRRAGDAILGFPAGSATAVATLRLPAGSWFVEADTEGTWFPNQSPSQDSFSCGLVVDGQSVQQKEAFLGNIAGATHFATFTLRQAVVSNGSTTVVLRCSHTGVLAGGSSVPAFRSTTLTATDPASLEVEDVNG